MATLLFSSHQKRERLLLRRYYPRHLSFLVRGARDTLQAMCLFESLVTSGTPNGHHQFDAHCGDSACQIRPLMFLEILQAYKSQLTFEFGVVKGVLGSVIDRALHIHQCLTNSNVSPAKTNGLSPRHETYNSFYAKTGLDIWFTHDIQTSHGPAQLVDDPFAEGEALLKDQQLPIWDVGNPLQVTQFLVYAYLLSRFKTRIYDPKSSKFVYRVSHRSAFDYYQSRDGDVSCSSPYRVPDDGPSHVSKESSSMQVWMSKLTCSFLFHLCSKLRMPDAVEGILKETIIQSPRGITAAPTFLTFPLIREGWIAMKAPVFLVVQRFCRNGSYHVNFFAVESAQAEPLSQPRDDACSLYTRLFGIGSQFRAHLLDHSLFTEQGGKSQRDMAVHSVDEPHICVVASSVDGSIQDLISYTMDVEHRGALHEDPQCAENEECIESVLANDFNQTCLMFFAQHGDYPFAADNKSDMAPLAESFSRYGYGHLNRIRQNWKSRADFLGIGRNSMCLYSLAHFFLGNPRDVVTIYERQKGSNSRLVLPGFLEDL
ncbi:hypothetical protein K493DRAFT_390856 [Basidiobolus meristosporus CBS 931.73]|uniref:Uncharacterized protein n=1 Tax=Basidiobolus meristosporus CBS 931.73 TaxID=1314790 RepID=A0A1Y1X1B0_9FUNG|nr:hypothetical protein K493DRAFT_390856 [Basidiobolus meristosporus CBS 931.73]|eukprot:ORX79398.1 hypothetical protein K493DRAFT_390856 [Basidiobolus meristosporus CBS 931.73]